MADPSAGYRKALARLLSHELVQIVGEAADTVELSLAVERLRPDVVLLDPELPGLHGSEAVRKLTGISPGSRVIFLSQGKVKPPHESPPARPALVVVNEPADVTLIKRILEAVRAPRPR